MEAYVITSHKYAKNLEGLGSELIQVSENGFFESLRLYETQFYPKLLPNSL